MAHAREATRQLNMFVGSPYVIGVCGKYASQELLAWLANSFFVHSESLYFCYRKVYSLTLYVQLYQSHSISYTKQCLALAMLR
jgi:hypothetical protein